MGNTEQNTGDGDEVGGTQRERVSPSAFMRKLRPEYYSDTSDRVAYVLDKSVFEYWLSSITQRNQTHDFEVFCRKLCERTISPFLRAQSGPEGGGDSKADTETFAVADEIAVLSYVGEVGDGKERWAFAFSAKAKWSDKVRADVAGIVGTERGYKRIIFVTSQAVRSKDRARVEDELSKAHGIPVTIHDRAWIVDQVIDHDRKDLAFNYLGVGEQKTDPLRLGPQDYSRLQQLTELYRLIEDPAAFAGMERQRATEALLAAKLARGLERPRSEIEGRFLRAIRLAEKDGTYQQHLEAQYELIWTGYWWFDDALMLNSAYPTFEAMALKGDHALNLELLGNINQLLVNSVLHGLLTSEQCTLRERMKTLEDALAVHAQNLERPNNRLEAKTSLLTLRLNRATLENDRDGLAAIWIGYRELLDEVRSMGEYNFERLEKMIDAVGTVAGNEPAYNELVEKLADVVSERTSEARGALILLKRAQQLDFDDHFEMIRLLGRAAFALTKKEHSESLIEALQLLSLAYRSAGLMWASRASCVFAAASIVVDANDAQELPAIFVPTMKIWAWISLELRHLPDFLSAVQLLNGCLAGLPLDEESQDQVREDLRDLNLVMGSVLANLDENYLSQLADLPDILERLQLFTSRTALLYVMGQTAAMRADGSLPPEESDDDVRELMCRLKSQPVGEKTRYRLALNGVDRPQTLNAMIMGMSVDLTAGSSELEIMVAEAVLGSLEAFFATALHEDVSPHTERLRISLVLGDDPEPQFVIDELRMRATLHWPKTLSPASFQETGVVQRSLAQICGMVLGATCLMKDGPALLDKLFKDEAVQQRMAMIVAALNSYHRLTDHAVTRLSRWSALVQKTYDLIKPLPVLDAVELNETDVSEVEEPIIRAAGPGQKMRVRSHRDIAVRSVIALHAWDKASWCGTLYANWSEDGSSPPGMAFMFESEEAARVIFELWRERFGKADESEAIRISIVRNLPEQPLAWYCVLVGPKELTAAEMREGRAFNMPSRSMTMTPDDTVNLDRFLSQYRRHGYYFIMPAVVGEGSSQPKLITDLCIRKRHLAVREASDVQDYEMDIIAVRRPDIRRV